MAKYLIPTEKLDNLKKKVAHIKNKGAFVIYKELGTQLVPATLYVELPNSHGQVRTYNIERKCMLVEISGEYIINGWQFVGTIIHTPNSNIIRTINDSFDVPTKYMTSECFCEHCRTHRLRKDTYLVYNESTHEYKQVGRNCLQEYTTGLDAEMCASILSTLDIFRNNAYDREDVSWCSFQQCGYYGWNRKDMLSHAIPLVRKYGFVKDITRNMLIDYVNGNDYEDKFGDLVVASDSEIALIDEYANAIPNDYVCYKYNAKITWLKECVEYRDLNMICSFIATYLKETKTLKEKANSEYVGQVGDKVEINIQSVRVLYTKHNHYGYGYTNTYVQEIIDEKGNIYIWSSETSLVNLFEDYRADKKTLNVKATIKAHSEYKGIKQTIITRAKII